MIDATKFPTDVLIDRVRQWMRSNAVLPTTDHESLRLDVVADGMTVVVLLTTRTHYTPKPNGVEPVQRIERQTVWNATDSQWSLDTMDRVRRWSKTLVDAAMTDLSIASGEA